MLMIRPPRSVFLVGLATAFSLLGDQAMYAVLPVCFKELGLLPIQVGLILSINRWIRLLTNHIAVRALERYSTVRLLSAVLLLGSLITLTYSFSPQFYLLLTARMLWGLCWSFLRQAGMMTVVGSAPGINTAQVMGYFHGLVRIGSVSGLLLGGILFDLIGYGHAFLILGMVSLAGLPLVNLSPKGPKQKTESFYSDQKFKGFSASSVLLVCGFVLGCVGSGLITATLGAILKHLFGSAISLGPLLIGVATLNGLLLGGRWVLESLFAPVLGALNDRIGLPLGTPIFFGLGTISLFACGLTSHILLMSFFILLFVICETSLASGIAAQAGRRGPRTIALYATALDLGAAAGPIIGWVILEFMFSPGVIFILGSAFFLIATIVSWQSFKKEGNSSPGKNIGQDY